MSEVGCLLPRQNLSYSNHIKNLRNEAKNTVNSLQKLEHQRRTHEGPNNSRECREMSLLHNVFDVQSDSLQRMGSLCDRQEQKTSRNAGMRLS